MEHENIELIAGELLTENDFIAELDKQKMIDSYNNISFYGEKRGEQDYEYYSSLLQNDLIELGENTGNYRAKFIAKVMDIYYKQARCTSAFIVGPANYNLRKHEKSWASRDNAYEHFVHWRNKYFKAVNRVRTLSPEAEIDKAIERLEFLESEKSKLPYKWSHELTEEEKEKHCSVYNVTTKIRETRKKIEVMKQRIEAKNNSTELVFPGGKIYIENDRVIIAHDEKPSSEVIEAIKKRGFRWSPKMGNWCRKHTGNAVYDAKKLFADVLNKNR